MGEGTRGREEEREGRLWPSAAYARQLERLRGAVGRPVFLVELRTDEMQLGVHLCDRPQLLLDVVDFPRPDPALGLAPHLLVLEDGRGVNLGRIARVSLETPFAPEPEQLLYEDPFLLERLLYRERRLSREFTARRSRLLLARVLGYEAPDAPALEEPPDSAPESRLHPRSRGR